MFAVPPKADVKSGILTGGCGPADEAQRWSRAGWSEPRRARRHWYRRYCVLSFGACDIFGVAACLYR
jgi:hypothetical protein